MNKRSKKPTSVELKKVDPAPVVIKRNKKLDKIDLKSAVLKWTKDKFLMRSSFYTGRGVNTGDLSSEMLEQIYQGIKKEVGQTEATNFANFVANLRDLSASAFIQSFEQFWYRGCPSETVEQEVGTGNQITGNDEERAVEGFTLLATAFSGGLKSREETEMESFQIKAFFIALHHKEIASTELIDRPFCMYLEV